MPKLNFTIDLLATRSFARLAAVLRNCSGVIMQRWDDTVRDVLPNADALTRDQLRNSLPDMMEEIARALESDQPATTLELIEMTKSHGATRFHQQYSIREMLAEYRMWRRILVEEVWRGVGGELEEVEVTALNMAVDTALEGGMLAYTDHQMAQIRHAAEIESKYLSFLSHDLRNHLNHATLLLQLHTGELKQTGAFERVVQDLESVQRSIQQTTEGMERLLEAERLRNGAVEPKREQVDLRSLVSTVAGEFAYQIRNKGLAVQVDVPEGMTVHSDSQLLGLILRNLVGNAVKYSEKGLVQISARTNGNETGWAISVSDQGPGIAEEQRHHLFQAFARGDTHGQPGTGLGLSIVAAATRLLGGHLQVESKPGEGTTFRLVVP